MTLPIVIVPYDPAWPDVYEDESRAIQAAARPWIVAVEHVGSTAVPGLGAKPIVDIMAGVRGIADAAHVIPLLAQIGYEYAPEFETLIPERRFFRKGPPERRCFHLHVVEFGGAFWERHLLFRDYLRLHPAVSREYQALKRELAERFGADRSSYTDAKTDFISAAEIQARLEADRSGTSFRRRPRSDGELAQDLREL